MTPDAHTACPLCAQVVRDLYAISRRVLVRMHHDPILAPEYDELLAAVDAVRPLYDAHHGNQLHSHSPELEDARHPTVTEAV
jgi:hypothetical protein